MNRRIHSHLDIREVPRRIRANAYRLSSIAELMRVNEHSFCGDDFDRIREISAELERIAIRTDDILLTYGGSK